MSAPGHPLRLSPVQIMNFMTDGFVRVDAAFPRVIAEAARSAFWGDLRAQGFLPDDPRSWMKPVVRLGMYPQPGIVAAANTPILHAAFDQLVGPGLWRPCRSMGTVPVRFPSDEDPGDTGWHVDASFGTDTADFMEWRTSVHARGRTLLMLFLFSDTAAADAPTRIRVGSHRDIARALAPAGESGLTLRELVPHFDSTQHRPEALATGPAGTVYLCHPFLVHAAQMHRGTEPRFLAQPPLLPVVDQWLPDVQASDSPVARAISLALREELP